MVAQIRREKGLSQKSVGEAMRVPTQRVSSIELGKTNLTLSAIIDVANALEVEVARLFVEPQGKVTEVKRGRPFTNTSEG